MAFQSAVVGWHRPKFIGQQDERDPDSGPLGASINTSGINEWVACHVLVGMDRRPPGHAHEEHGQSPSQQRLDPEQSSVLLGALTGAMAGPEGFRPSPSPAPPEEGFDLHRARHLPGRPLGSTPFGLKSPRSQGSILASSVGFASFARHSAALSFLPQSS